MAFRATLSVVLGCNYASASRLLSAAERGDEQAVQQVIKDKPQLAAFSGFHGTTSPLHRAAAAGHLGVCRAIIEPLKARVRAAEAAAASKCTPSLPGGAPSGAGTKWQRLLATVLNQRSHKSLTPLMLACEHGHAAVAAYLLREGADPLAADFVHSRTCLHYAAVGGHAECLRLLCSDTAMVHTQDGRRPLRDVIVSDVQVQACRFIDQRAFGGLTALHFAVVTGNLDAVQVLLRAGSSIMVKSDGEAYIGEDFLVPGSTPLHVAVIINSISIVHAILQAHMEMMNILGTSLDERGRRPWEGTSRTDIRSVRNAFRKLPFHLARERQHPQMMSLVDPRIPVDVALDAARDTEHGIGPKRLSTICSLVLQRSLLQWLDDCQRELAQEAAAKQQRLASVHSALDAMAASKQRPAGSKPPRPAAGSPAPTGGAGGGPPGGGAPGSDASSPPPMAGLLAGADPPPRQAPAAAAPATMQNGGSNAAAALPSAAGQAASTSADAADSAVSPFAALANMAEAPWSRTSPPLHVSASAPATPARDLAALPHMASGASGAAATEGVVQSLAAAAEDGGGDSGAGSSSMQRMASLHGYMGMLSLKRPQSARSLEAARGYAAAGMALPRGSGGRSSSRQLSGSVTPRPLSRSNSGSGLGGGAAGQTARVRFLTDPGIGGSDVPAAAAPVQAAALAAPGSDPSPRGSLEESPRNLTAQLGLSEQQAAATITVMPPHRRTSSQANMRLGNVFGGLRERLRSTEALSPAGSGPLPAAAAPGAGAAGGGLGGALLGEKHSEKDLGLESELELPSPSSQSEEDSEDQECGVCLDAVVDVAFAACQHKLCLECARNLTRQDKKPPHCPFCRRLVVGFQRVSGMGALHSHHHHTHGHHAHAHAR